MKPLSKMPQWNIGLIKRHEERLGNVSKASLMLIINLALASFALILHLADIAPEGDFDD